MAHALDGHVRVTYEEIHSTIAASAAEIKEKFNPDLLIAIAGGGLIPTRIIRTFLKSNTERNLPIQVIGLSLYEDLEGSEETSEEVMGKEVIRTQWLDFSTLGHRPLIGRTILIVDEVDDSRTTLAYAVAELQKDIASQVDSLPEAERSNLPETKIGIFVVHNKLKPKLCNLPTDVAYFAGEAIEDRWVDYPWEQTNIALHNAIGLQQKALGLQ